MAQTKRLLWDFLDKEWADLGLTNEDSFLKPSWNFASRMGVLFLIFFWAFFSILDSLAVYKKHRTITLTTETFLERKLHMNDKRGQMLVQTLYFLPQSHYKSLRDVKIQKGMHHSHEPRGKANASHVILSEKDMSDMEFLSVFLHEMGHVVDLGMLTSDRSQKSAFERARSGDPSITFYSVSWESQNERKETTNRGAFISGYSLSNPYEDFAESYDFYLLHGNEFRKRSLENKALKERYAFLKKNVFFGKEFSFSDPLYAYPEKFFDVTVLPYDFDSFLVAINFSHPEEEDERVQRQRRQPKNQRNRTSLARRIRARLQRSRVKKK